MDSLRALCGPRVPALTTHHVMRRGMMLNAIIIGGVAHMWERRLPLSTGEVTAVSPCEGTGGGQGGTEED